MNSKQRMQAVFAGERPDRVPTGELGVDYPVTDHVLGRRTYYRGKLREKRAVWEGRRDEVVASQKRDLVDLAMTLGWDWIPVFLTYSASNAWSVPEFVDETTWKDAYGRTWKYSEVTEDILCVDMPRPDEAALRVLECPFTPDPSQLDLVRHVVTTLGETHFIVGRTSIELRDALPYIGGGPVDGSFPEPYGGLMMDLVDFSVQLFDDPALVKRLLAAATQRAIDVALTLIREGVDAIVMDADYCHQSGPIISPRHCEEFVLPMLKMQIDAIHEAGAYAIKHTDGNTWPILGMLQEAGIDGLHGIQPSAGMDLGRLREACGRRLVLFGAVEGGDLMNRTPAEIRELVRGQIRTAGADGGFVLTSSNSIQLGVPPVNYLAMVEAVRSCGEYPLR